MRIARQSKFATPAAAPFRIIGTSPRTRREHWIADIFRRRGVFSFGHVLIAAGDLLHKF